MSKRERNIFIFKCHKCLSSIKVKCGIKSILDEFCMSWAPQCLYPDTMFAKDSMKFQDQIQLYIEYFNWL